MEVVVARRQEQVELGQRPPALGGPVHDQLADRLGTGGAAGLAGDDAVDAAPPGAGELAQLRRFARPLPALEGDEAGARQRAGPPSRQEAPQTR